MQYTDYAAWSWTPGMGIDGLQQVRRPLQCPAAGEVLIANRAFALNPVDWKMIEWGHPAWRDGQVPGVDGVGVVTAAGNGVDIIPGTRVAYHQALGREGSFAEYCRVEAATVLRVPAVLNDAAAACLPCPGLTAWQALGKIPPAPGRDVLVVGAGGAVGLFLTQLALQRGWRVWATAAPRHHRTLLELGVVGVFDYRQGDWSSALRERLGERRLYALFDTVSGPHAATLAPLLGYNGHLVCIQDRQETAPLPAFGTALSLHEVALNSVHEHGNRLDRQELRQAGEGLLRALADGSLLAPERSAFAFEALPDALRALKDGSGGKWVTQLQAAPTAIP